MVEFRRIKGYKNYGVTSDGCIWKQICPRPSTTDRFFVRLASGSKRVCKYVHRLVLESFVGECPENMEACHSNGKHHDNSLSNLRWDTHSNNMKDAVLHGTHHKTKLNPEQVKLIHAAYWDGVDTEDLAFRFSVNTTTILDIANKRTWSFIWE